MKRIKINLNMIVNVSQEVSWEGLTEEEEALLLLELEQKLNSVGRLVLTVNNKNFMVGYRFHFRKKEE